MKKQYAIPFTCVCDNKRVEVSFKKPNFYSGSTFSYICPSCESEFMIRVIKDTKSDQFKVFVRNEFLSAKFSTVMAMRKTPTP